MKQLSTADRVRIVSALSEGCSIRATCRMTGFAKGTVTKLLVDMGDVCREYHDENVRGLACKRIQADEIWSFVGCKEKAKKYGAQGHGDAWTWTALDPDTKMIVSYLVAARDAGAAFEFMHDLAGRVTRQVQITTDGLSAYIEAVMENFGEFVDFAQLIKLFGNDPRFKASEKYHPERTYSPVRCCGLEKVVRCGNPDEAHISTSFVERNNLTMRMQMRRFTRLTNAFSKKIENHESMIAIHFMHYNFCRVHQTTKTTPAKAAGLTDHVWTLAELVGLLEAKEAAVVGTDENKRGPYKKQAAKDSD